MFHQKTKDAAKGQWRGILMHLGVPGEALKNRHGPCPVCGGTDRFRWDNKEGNGTFFCSSCGPGDGLSLAMKYTGRPFTEIAPQIDAILGNHKFEKDRETPTYNPDQVQAWLRELARSTVKITPGDVVDRYLHGRGVGADRYPKALRFARQVRTGDGGVFPAMVATVQAPDGTNATLHRTFLRPDGSGKADLGRRARMLMPGGVPDGAAVRLGEIGDDGVLGVAEGIETALSAARLFGVPVWSAINTTMLEKFEPPAECRTLVIYADNDEKFGGLAAAYRLAHRIACDQRRRIAVEVQVPERVGEDWNDVLLARQGQTGRLAHGGVGRELVMEGVR